MLDGTEPPPPRDSSVDEPLPGLDPGPAVPRASHAKAREGLDHHGQGRPLPDWWEDGFREWLEAERDGRNRANDQADPIALRGGELCDRCDELAMFATEHIWRRAGEGSGAARDLARWRSGILLWCRRHLRENELELLTDGAVLVGVRGA